MRPLSACQRRGAQALGLGLALMLTCVGGGAWAHGGLPVAQEILFDGEKLVVPTRYWGVFMGRDGGEWRWICEEAINSNQQRAWAFARSGAIHVTDFAGITSSRDGGCTWVQSSGEIQLRSTSHVAAHPVEGRRAFATTDQGKTAPWNALFRTDDDGLTWTVPSEDIKADEFLRGVVLSPDGRRLYVTGFARSPTAESVTVLHSSSDGGNSWKAAPLPWKLCDGATPPSCFVPDRVVPITVDPVEADLVYLRVETPALMVLLSAHADGTARELLRVASEDKKPGIGGMAFVPEQKAVLVATGEGPYRSIAGGKMERFGNLSRGECLSPRGDALYACGWTFAPDSMAIARAPLAEVAMGNPTFTKVWNYDETCGPVTTCPASSPVGMICPGIWRTYGPSLGAEGKGCQAGDAGSGGGGDGGCSCGVAAPAGGGGGRSGGGGFALLLGLVATERWMRRTRRTRS